MGMGSFNRMDSADSRHTEQQNRLGEQESPWMFRALILESQYQNELRDSLYDRTRPAAKIFIGYSWLSKIHYFIILYFSEWKTEEMIIALLRTFLLAFFTAVFTMKLKAETRRRAGTPFIWISRAVFLPILLCLETGIPVFYTEVLAAQV
jgi:hypothetical protein